MQALYAHDPVVHKLLGPKAELCILHFSMTDAACALSTSAMQDLESTQEEVVRSKQHLYKANSAQRMKQLSYCTSRHKLAHICCSCCLLTAHVCTSTQLQSMALRTEI